MATSLPTVHLLTTLVRNAAPCPFAMPHAVWFHADGAVLGHFYQPSTHPEFLNSPHLLPHSNSGGSSSGGAAAQSALRFTVDWPPEELLLQETKGQQQRRGKDRGGEDPETAQRRIRRDVLEMFTTGWSSNRGKQKMHSRRNSGGNGSGLGPKQQRQQPPPPQDGYNSTMMSNASTQQQQRLELDSTCDIVALLLTPSPPSTQSSSSASSSAPPTMETDFLNLSRLETYCYSSTGTATEALLLRFPFAQQPLATDYRLTVAHLCVSMRTGACISQEVRRCRQPLLLPPTATTPSPEENAPPHADGVAAVQSVSVAERTLLPSHGLSSVPRSTTHRLDLMAAQLFQALGGSSSSSSKSDHSNPSEEPQPLQLFLVLDCDSALKHVSRYFLLGAASAAPYDLKTDKHDADRSITATSTATTPAPKENKQAKRGGDEISWVIEESQAKPTHSPQRTKSHRNHNSSGSSSDNHRSPPSPSRSAAAAADDSHRVRHPSSSDVPRFLGEGPRYLRDHEVSSLSRTPCWSLSSGAAVRNDDTRSPARSQTSEAKGPVAVEPEAIAMEQTSYLDGLFGTCGWMGGYFVDPPACLVPHLATSRSLVSYGAGQPKLTEDPQRAAAAADGKPTAAFAQCLSSTALRELFVKRAQQFGPQQRAQRTLSSYANPFAATDQQERVTKLAKQQKTRERAAATAMGKKGHNNDDDSHPQKDDENNLRHRRQLLAPLPSATVSAHRTTFMDRFMEAVGAHPNALREIPSTAPRDDGDVDVRSPTSLFSLTSASLYGANGTFSSGGGGAAGLAATSGYFVMTEEDPASQQQQQPNTTASLTVLQRRRLMTNPPPPLTEVCDAQGGAQPPSSNTIQTTTKSVLGSASASSSPPRGSPSRNQTTQAMYDLLCRLLDLRETTTMFTDAFYAVYSHQHTRGPWTVLALELPTLKAVELLYWAGVVHRLQCAVETTTASRRKAKITRVNLYVLLPAGRLAALGLLPRLVEHQSEAMQRFVSSMAPQPQPQQPAEVALLRPHPAVKECLIQGKRSQQELAHTEETVRSLLKQLARLTAPNLGASTGRPSTADQESDPDDDDEAEDDLGDDDAPPQKDSATRTVSSEGGGRQRDAPQRTATTATTTSTTASTVKETSSPPHEDDAPLRTVEEILSKLEQYSVLRALIQRMGAEFPRQL